MTGNLLDDIKCPLCGKKMGDHPLNLVAPGSNAGSGEELGNNIMGNRPKDSHKFYLENKVVTPPNGAVETYIYKGGGIEAHHLICSEAMDTDDWEDLCREFGYNINKKENGVFLPNKIEYACHLHLPLHKSGHEAAFGQGNMRYPESVSKVINQILHKYRNKPCEKKQVDDFNQDLDNISKEIFGYVDKFTWWITQDGFHYQGGNPIGCSGAEKMKDKHDQRSSAKKAHNQGSNNKITVGQMTKIRQARVVGYQFMKVCECGRYHKEFRGKKTINILKISE